LNTVPVKALLRPDAFIEIEVTASSAPGKPATSGAVFLPTVQPVDDRGDIVGAGDVVAQTRANATPKERGNWRLIGGGVGIHGRSSTRTCRSRAYRFAS
jgi:hypothetical protein